MALFLVEVVIRSSNTLPFGELVIPFALAFSCAAYSDHRFPAIAAKQLAGQEVFCFWRSGLLAGLSAFQLPLRQQEIALCYDGRDAAFDTHISAPVNAYILIVFDNARNTVFIKGIALTGFKPMLIEVCANLCIAFFFDEHIKDCADSLRSGSLDRGCVSPYDRRTACRRTPAGSFSGGYRIPFWSF